MGTKLEIVRLSEVESKPIDWLWYPYIPYGKLTMIQGDPGGGKNHVNITSSWSIVFRSSITI